MEEIQVIKKELYDYYDYIKTVYLGEYSKLLTEDKKNEILKLSNDVIKVDETNKFIVRSIDGKIVFNLNIDDYINENGLLDNNNFRDILNVGIEYRDYLLSNKNNIKKIIKELLLEHVIRLFTGIKSNDVISVGTVNLITMDLASKFKLPTNNILHQKEAEVARVIKNIVGEAVLKKAIINNLEDEIETKYNLCLMDLSEINKNSYKDLKKELNKEYSYYINGLNKVYLTDSLYQYEKINYKDQLNMILKVSEGKKIHQELCLKRLSSIVKSINEFTKIKDIFNNEERNILYNSGLEMNNILEKIKKDGNNKQNIICKIDTYYNQICKIEDNLLPLSEKVWTNLLTIPELFEYNKPFNFLVDFKNKKIDKNDFILAKYVNNYNINTLKSDTKNFYGFIYPIIKNSILATSFDDLTYQSFKNVEDYQPNFYTSYAGNIPLEIESKETSKLVIPNSEDTSFKVLINGNQLRPIGIFCIYQDNIEDLEESTFYKKVEDIATTYELPLIIWYDKNIKKELEGICNE